MERDSKGRIKRKYPIKEKFFDIIDTEQKAYFLGFLFADGYNNTDRNSINLGLREDDKEILEKLNVLIQPTKPLQYINQKATRLKGTNTQNQYRLVMCSSYMSKKLDELGCSKSKTHFLKYPTDEVIPKELQHHFIRGYFDGDGHVRKKKREQFSITGNKDFIIGIQNLLIKQLTFKRTKLMVRFPERGTNTVSLISCGVNKAKSFSNWLYKDATIYLKRKKDIFDSYPFN